MELNVEPEEGPCDGLDNIKNDYVVNPAHFLRQYRRVLDHSKRCTGGYMSADRDDNKGFHGVLKFSCKMCQRIETVTTVPLGAGLGPGINKAAVWGTLAVGMGRKQLQELMSLMNVAVPGDEYFRELENTVGEVRQAMRRHSTYHYSRSAPLNFCCVSGVERAPRAHHERGHRRGKKACGSGRRLVHGSQCLRRKTSAVHSCEDRWLLEPPNLWTRLRREVWNGEFHFLFLREGGGRRRGVTTPSEQPRKERGAAMSVK